MAITAVATIRKASRNPRATAGGSSTAIPLTPAHAPAFLVRPTAAPARLRPRHRGLALSFLLLVALPFVTLASYLGARALPQFVSVAGFTVRQTEAAPMGDVLGGIAQFAGAGNRADADILHDFILSQSLVQSLDARLDLRGHFSAGAVRDPLFALVPEANLEALVAYWQRIVHVGFDPSSGLVDVQVRAFDPAMAEAIAAAILEEGQRLVNALNATARADALRFAETDLAASQERLRHARAALTAFRIRTRIVDPAADLQGRMGVLTSLQQQLAQALIDLDLIRANTSGSADARLRQASQRVEVIEQRIADERSTFSRDTIGAGGEDYPTLMAEYEGLVVEREFAERAYGAALAALDATRANTARQSRYLAVHIAPTLAESATAPRTLSILGLAGLFLLLGWSILALVYYALRDRP